jgi:hypothetical protein
LGFDLGALTPDANTIRLCFGMMCRIIRRLRFRERLNKATV